MLQKELADVVTCSYPSLSCIIQPPTSTGNVLEPIHVAEFEADVATGGMVVTEDGTCTENSIIAFENFSGK